ncbi:MAG: S41 family peptidase [Chitinophagaceae bacterium]|nr:S41 family peptidase [Chitinophagaceae bacterium]MCB9046706.1 S41 family peptidase [Chitinophagales bacterium]
MKRIIVFLSLIIMLTSCERLLMPDPTPKSNIAVFENLWKTLDEGYVYFEYKDIDWDTIHREYLKKIYDTMETRAFYDTCVKMLKLLHDPSVSMKTEFAEFYFIDTTYYNANFNRKLLERFYWKDHEKTGPFIHTIIDSIGYVYYESFNDEVKDAQLDIIIEKLRLNNDSIKGVVFDIRNNRGGDIRNAFTLLKRMGIDTNYTITAQLWKAYYKQGPEHDEFADAQTSYLEQSDKTKFPKQFILLTNRGTLGSAALFATGAQGYPNVKVYGDTTGGQAGMIVGAELSNGWQITFPGSYYTTDDDRNIEEGVPPTLRVDMDPNDKTHDAILDAALNAIKNP